MQRLAHTLCSVNIAWGWTTSPALLQPLLCRESLVPASYQGTETRRGTEVRSGRKGREGRPGNSQRTAFWSQLHETDPGGGFDPDRERGPVLPVQTDGSGWHRACPTHASFTVGISNHRALAGARPTLWSPAPLPAAPEGGSSGWGSWGSSRSTGQSQEPPFPPNRRPAASAQPSGGECGPRASTRQTPTTPHLVCS